MFYKVCSVDIRLEDGFESLSGKVFGRVCFYVYVCRYVQMPFMYMEA